MIGFAVRNLKVFFKDKSAVFFSLLAVFIIIGLYALFLGDVWVSGLKDLKNARYLMDSWIVAGLLAVTSVTTTMGAFGMMVEDKSKKIIKDFVASPLKYRNIAGGYIISAYIIGVVLSLVALVLAEGYILANGGELMSLDVLLKVLGLILLATFTNTSLVLFLVSFFNSSTAFSTACSIIGTLIGFLTGIYLPIGQFPGTVQWVVKVFPVSHAAVLFRQVIMAEPLETAFEGVPTEAVDGFKETMGVTLKFADSEVTPLISIGILMLTAIVFYGLSVINISRKKR